jgi:LCP family protein required for cell wall assembly
MRNPFKKKDPLVVERYSGVVRGVRTRGRGRLRWLRRKWVWALAAVLVVVGAVGGYGLWYYYSLQGDIQEDIGGIDKRENDEDPFNVLLVGSDSRKGLTEEEPIRGERADTLIFAHVDPETNHVTMVQFPRDLYVRLADGSKDKINSALLHNKSFLVRSIKQVTGLHVNVYAQVNIAGFKDLVDAIDGVEVCVPDPIPFDPGTGIEIKPDEVGMVEFDGERAVRFVRSRKAFGEGDLARIQNQQKFLSAAIDKVTSPATFLSFGKLIDIKNAAGRNVRVDSNTDLRELYDILRRFRAFDPRNYEAYTAPNIGIAENEAGSVVLPDPPAINAMFRALARNESPAEMDNVPNVKPSEITVGVYNGVNHNKTVARPAASALVAATTLDGESIDVVERDNANRDDYKRTVVRYERDNRIKAKLIAAAIPDARLKRADTKLGIDVEVIVGDGFKAQRVIRISPIKIPVPGELPPECRGG